MKVSGGVPFHFPLAGGVGGWASCACACARGAGGGPPSGGWGAGCWGGGGYCCCCCWMLAMNMGTYWGAGGARNWGGSGGSTWRMGGRWWAVITLILSCSSSSSICCTSGGAMSCSCPSGICGWYKGGSASSGVWGCSGDPSLSASLGVSPSLEDSACWDSLGVCRSVDCTLGVWGTLEGPAPSVCSGIGGSAWGETAGVKVMQKGL